MKIVQSFWSGNLKKINNNFGWQNYRYNWISWILSCHQLVKFHKDVELYTDEFGYWILIEKLKLPYTKVHVMLDELNHYNKDLWAIAKIKTFQLQNEPFLHVDGDVFVWESLTDKFKDSNLITQNLEIATDYYRGMWDSILPNLKFLPKEMHNYNTFKSNLACNMGVVGGTNINFFQEYTKKSFEFVNENKIIWEKIDSFNFNIFFEQVLFHEYAKQDNQQIDYLFDEISNDNSYVGFGDFHKIPNKKYLHLLGVYKRNAHVCKAMEIYTMKYYYDSYSLLANLINKEENNNEVIDFLTSKKINKLLSEFDTELKKNEFEPIDFLLKRDLYNEGLSNKLEMFFEIKKNFTIVLLNGIQKESIDIQDEKIDCLKIEEINCEHRVYDLDQIDFIMLEELSKPIKYDLFIEKMSNYFDYEEEDQSSKKEFLHLIKNRIRNYVIFKIISIY